MTCGGAVEAFSERASHARPKIKTNSVVKYVNRNSKDVRGASEQHAPPRALGSSVLASMELSTVTLMSELCT